MRINCCRTLFRSCPLLGGPRRSWLTFPSLRLEASQGLLRLQMQAKTAQRPRPQNQQGRDLRPPRPERLGKPQHQAPWLAVPDRGRCVVFGSRPQGREKNGVATFQESYPRRFLNAEETSTSTADSSASTWKCEPRAPNSSYGGPRLTETDPEGILKACGAHRPGPGASTIELVILTSRPPASTRSAPAG